MLGRALSVGWMTDLEAQMLCEQTWLTVEMRITYGFLWGPAVLLEWEIILSKECLLHHNFRLELPCGKSDMGSCIQPWSDQCGSHDNRVLMILCLTSPKNSTKIKVTLHNLYTWVHFNFRSKHVIILSMYSHLTLDFLSVATIPLQLWFIVLLI